MVETIYSVLKDLEKGINEDDVIVGNHLVVKYAPIITPHKLYISELGNTTYLCRGMAIWTYYVNEQYIQYTSNFNSYTLMEQEVDVSEEELFQRSLVESNILSTGDIQIILKAVEHAHSK